MSDHKTREGLAEYFERYAAGKPHEIALMPYEAEMIAKALRSTLEPSGVPSEPTHEMLKALAGDPVILAASDEAELRKRWRTVMLSRISGPTSKPECICPKCGLRHGGAVLGDLGF